MHRGYIKLWRKSLESNIWSLGPIAWTLWCWCLMRANHKDAFVFGIQVPRGSFISGRDNGSAECKISPFQWYRGMKKLQQYGAITQKSHNRFTLVSVLNYSLYNDVDSAPCTTGAQQPHNGCTTGAQQPHTNKNEKNKENDNNNNTSTIVDVCDTAPADSPSSDCGKSKIYFPIKDGKTWDLPQRKLDEYLANYSDRLDVLAEFRKAYQWLRVNKPKRKSAGGMPKFLTLWLNNSYDTHVATVAGGTKPDDFPTEEDVK